MYRYPDSTFKVRLPSHVLVGDVNVDTTPFTVGQWDELGYNAAIKLAREPFTTYTCEWVKGEDKTYRENALTETFDLDAAQQNKLNKIQLGKNTARDGGFEVDGVTYDSDTTARLAYLELADKLKADPSFTTTWKATEYEWVVMDAALYAQIAAAGETLIQSVYDWQTTQSGAALAATDRAELAAVSEVYA